MEPKKSREKYQKNKNFDVNFHPVILIFSEKNVIKDRQRIVKFVESKISWEENVKNESILMMNARISCC